jgi:fibro-slime domain-containing protein
LSLRLTPNRVLGFAAALAVWALTQTGCAKVGGDQTTVDAGGSAGFGGAGGDSGAGATAGTDAASDVAPFEAPPSSTCGNGIIEFGENCDDGNIVSGDGCSSGCVVEPHYMCRMASADAGVASICTHDIVCGDGLIEGTEACDDGNTTSGDGCSSTCTLECGWECPPGTLCRAAKCGDGLVAGDEQCDDGNTTNGDGCSSICTLESKPASVPEGWVCNTPSAAVPTDGGTDAGAPAACKGPTTCTTTVCGNGKKEGTEQCDDGNKVTGDGCSPFCRLEPTCPVAGGACTNVCGSGLLLPGDTKQCDDGNTVSGDGCSSKCTIEPGFACTNVAVSQNPLILPIVYHDFQSWKDPNGHPDFEHYLGNGVAGMAAPTLGANGAPTHVPMCVAWSSNLCAPGTMTPTWDPTVDWFGMWYIDTPAYNKTIVQTLSLAGQVNGVTPPVATPCDAAGQPACTGFQFSSTAFFPIDGMGWGNTPGQADNFGFTSVTRYWFQYSGAATLSFFGDDDVFVYINKTLAVDLGGTHQRAEGSITLDAANGTGYSCDFVTPGAGNVNGLAAACSSPTQTGGHMVNLGLTKGSIYEIAVFQAERHTTASNYQLTLNNFSGTKTSCKPACGDGVVTPPEKCDLGAAMNTGAYGGCNADCTLAPYCGDGKLTKPPEACDPTVPGTSNCDKNCKVVTIQ